MKNDKKKIGIVSVPHYAKGEDMAFCLEKTNSKIEAIKLNMLMLQESINKFAKILEELKDLKEEDWELQAGGTDIFIEIEEEKMSKLVKEDLVSEYENTCDENGCSKDGCCGGCKD